MPDDPIQRRNTFQRDIFEELETLARKKNALEKRVTVLERREEADPAIRSLAGAVGMMQMLPGLVGLWPGGVIRGSDRDGVADVSGNGLHLARNGGARIGDSSVSELVPAMFFNGINAYFSHADAAAFDISGTETVVQRSPPYRGLTLGGWFYFDQLSASEALLAKWEAGTTTNNSYLLQKFSGTDNIRLLIGDRALSGGVAVSTGEWVFCAGRFTPSTEMKVWTNDQTAVTGGSIPASISNGTQSFAIGVRNVDGTPTDFFDGRAALCFLCAAAVPDNIINNLYRQTRALFGV